jgi:diadenylate cyclase
MVEYVISAWQEISVTWLDLVDIFIVSFLIYQFLSVLRRTRAIKMTTGAIFVVAIYYVSEFIPLRTVNWMFRDIFGYIVFISVVLFQADIRRALSNIGHGSFFRYLNNSSTNNETIKEVVMALEMLRARKVGAIIAIERETGLRNYIESGIPLNSTVTYDLLLSIFQTESTLHDGAVIIESNRVAAAACFLPLASNPRSKTQLGSRHRAALGLSEESDAVVIVLSEETRNISLVLDGQIEANIKLEDLALHLESLILDLNPRLFKKKSREKFTP